MIAILGTLVPAFVQHHPVWTVFILLSFVWIYDSVLQSYANSRDTTKTSIESTPPTDS